jgi:hypothetical protein
MDERPGLGSLHHADDLVLLDDHARSFQDQ